MAMQQCPNGHLYDDSKNNCCPFCNGASLNVTMPLNPNVGQAPAADAFPATVGINNAPAQQEIGATQPLDTNFMKTTYVSSDDEADEVSGEEKVDVVRGWLVCISGSKKGTDYRLHGEKNTVGRGGENDVNISFDSSVSKGVNAIVAYERKKNKFYVYPEGVSKNNIYVNEELLMMPVELKDYDIIEVGSTKLAFRTFCNDLFNW